MKSHRLRGKSEAYRGYLRDKVASPVQYDEVYYQLKQMLTQLYYQTPVPVTNMFLQNLYNLVKLIWCSIINITCTLSVCQPVPF